MIKTIGFILDFCTFLYRLSVLFDMIMTYEISGEILIEVNLC